MIRGVTRLKASADPKATFICLSNSNQVFINTILKVCLGQRAVGSSKRDASDFILVFRIRS